MQYGHQQEQLSGRQECLTNKSVTFCVPLFFSAVDYLILKLQTQKCALRIQMLERKMGHPNRCYISILRKNQHCAQWYLSARQCWGSVGHTGLHPQPNTCVLQGEQETIQHVNSTTITFSTGWFVQDKVSPPQANTPLGTRWATRWGTRIANSTIPSL